MYHRQKSIAVREDAQKQVKAFKETLMKAKKLSNWIWEKSELDNLLEFTVIADQRSRHKVEIESCPSCTCPYFKKEKKGKNTCKHIVATLINKLNLPDNSILLPQVAFTQNEVEYLLDQLNTNGKSLEVPKEAEKTTTNLSFAEQQSIFEANEGNKSVQKWFLTNLLKEKIRKVVLVEVPCPRKSYMYT